MWGREFLGGGWHLSLQLTLPAFLISPLPDAPSPWTCQALHASAFAQAVTLGPGPCPHPCLSTPSQPNRPSSHLISLEAFPEVPVHLPLLCSFLASDCCGILTPVCPLPVTGIDLGNVKPRHAWEPTAYEGRQTRVWKMMKSFLRENYYELFNVNVIHQINIQQTCKIQHSFKVGLTASTLFHEWVKLFSFFGYIVVFYLYVLICCCWWWKEKKIPNIVALLSWMYAFKLIPWVSLVALFFL